MGEGRRMRGGGGGEIHVQFLHAESAIISDATLVHVPTGERTHAQKGYADVKLGSSL